MRPLQALYETPDEDTLQTWGVDYVVFDGSALARFDTDEDWYAERFRCGTRIRDAEFIKQPRPKSLPLGEGSILKINSWHPSE